MVTTVFQKYMIFVIRGLSVCVTLSLKYIFCNAIAPIDCISTMHFLVHFSACMGEGNGQVSIGAQIGVLC